MNMSALGRLRNLATHLQPQIQQTIMHPQRQLVSSSSEAVTGLYKFVDVLDSKIAYVDTGSDVGVSDNTVLFLHGNPTSSYLWRNVIPHVRGIARCLAPDLIGMGRSGKSGNGSYRFVDHYKYLSTWIEQMNFTGKIVIVCHDWGSGLGFHWCHQNSDRVKAIVFMEAMVNTVPSWDHFPEVARNMFQALRSPAGEELVLKKNFFVERLLPGAIIRKLTDEEMDVYRAPYREEGESRRPTLTWPREIPIGTDGPADVADKVSKYRDWLMNSEGIPKLYIDGDPGFFSPGIRETVANWKNLRTVKVRGSHFLQEDSPVEIGQAIAKFLLEDVYQ